MGGITPNVWIKSLRSQSKVGNVEMIERYCGIPISDFSVPAIFPEGAVNGTVTETDVTKENADGIDVNGVTYSVAYSLDEEDYSVDVTVYENKKVSPGVTGTYTLDLGVFAGDAK